MGVNVGLRENRYYVNMREMEVNVGLRANR